MLINSSGGVKMADFGFCVQLTQEKHMRHSMVRDDPCPITHASREKRPSFWSARRVMTQDQRPMVHNPWDA